MRSIHLFHVHILLKGFGFLWKPHLLLKIEKYVSFFLMVCHPKIIDRWYLYKGFIRTVFVNTCFVCCFGIVDDIVLCVSCPGTKNYYLLGCPYSGFNALCIVAVEIGDWR